jgi:hypothetical protein
MDRPYDRAMDAHPVQASGVQMSWHWVILAAGWVIILVVGLFLNYIIKKVNQR